MNEPLPFPSLDQHINMGRLTKGLRSQVMECIPLLSGVPLDNVCHETVGVLDQFRCKMDDLACRLVPQMRDPDGLALRIYYGDELSRAELVKLHTIARRVQAR